MILKFLLKNLAIETVRKLLPVRYILKEYLGTDYKDDFNEELEQEISENTRKNLRNIIKQEMENHSQIKAVTEGDNFSQLNVNVSEHYCEQQGGSVKNEEISQQNNENIDEIEKLIDEQDASADNQEKESVSTPESENNLDEKSIEITLEESEEEETSVKEEDSIVEQVLQKKYKY